jgi:hypothetical protein
VTPIILPSLFHGTFSTTHVLLTSD